MQRGGPFLDLAPEGVEGRGGEGKGPAGRKIHYVLQEGRGRRGQKPTLFRFTPRRRRIFEIICKDVQAFGCTAVFPKSSPKLSTNPPKTFQNLPKSIPNRPKIRSKGLLEKKSKKEGWASRFGLLQSANMVPKWRPKWSQKRENLNTKNREKTQ